MVDVLYRELWFLDTKASIISFAWLEVADESGSCSGLFKLPIDRTIEVLVLHVFGLRCHSR
jgi:hypothetical protein